MSKYITIMEVYKAKEYKYETFTLNILFPDLQTLTSSAGT